MRGNLGVDVIVGVAVAVLLGTRIGVVDLVRVGVGPVGVGLIVGVVMTSPFVAACVRNSAVRLATCVGFNVPFGEVGVPGFFVTLGVTVFVVVTGCSVAVRVAEGRIVGISVGVAEFCKIAQAKSGSAKTSNRIPTGILIFNIVTTPWNNEVPESIPGAVKNYAFLSGKVQFLTVPGI